MKKNSSFSNGIFPFEGENRGYFENPKNRSRKIGKSKNRSKPFFLSNPTSSSYSKNIYLFNFNFTHFFFIVFSLHHRNLLLFLAFLYQMLFLPLEKNSLE
jgi:hypothetical protein